MKFDIASEMNRRLNDPSFKSIFEGSKIRKTAAKKEEDKKEKDSNVKKEKGKPDFKDLKKSKKTDEKCKDKNCKQKKEKKAYNSCVLGLAKYSEIFDRAGLKKEASLTLLALKALAQQNPDTTDDKIRSVLGPIINKRPQDIKPFDKNEADDDPNKTITDLFGPFKGTKPAPLPSPKDKNNADGPGSDNIAEKNSIKNPENTEELPEMEVRPGNEYEMIISGDDELDKLYDPNKPEDDQNNADDYGDESSIDEYLNSIGLGDDGIDEELNEEIEDEDDLDSFASLFSKKK